jgi:hypothetical protein
VCFIDLLYKFYYDIQATAAPYALRFREEAILAPGVIPIDLSETIAGFLVKDNISVSLLFLLQVRGK